MNKKLSTAVFSFLLLIHSFSTFCQDQQAIDTLEIKLKKAKGADRVEILNTLTNRYVLVDSIKSFDYFKKATNLARELSLPNKESNAYQSLISGLKNEQSIIKLKNLLDYFQKERDKTGIGFSLSYLGKEYLVQNNYDQSEKFQKMALETFTNINHQYGISLSLERLGVLSVTKSEFLKGLEYYYQALQINEKNNFEWEEAVSLYHIGFAEMELGNYHLAIENILRTLNYWEKVNFIPNIWNCNELIGGIYLKLDEFDKAMHYHRIALKIREKVNYDLGIAYSCNNIAEVFLNTHQYDSAYYYALKSLKLKQNEKTGASKMDIANSQLNLGNIYAKTGKQDSALLLLTHAAATYQEIQSGGSFAEACYGIGNLYFDVKDFDKAKENYKIGLQKAFEIGDKSNIKTGNKLLSDLYKAQGDFENSLNYFVSYTNMKDSILNKERTNMIEELQIKFEVDKKQHIIENQQLVITQKKRQVAFSLVGGALILLFATGFILLILRNKRQKEALLQKEADSLRKDLEIKEQDIKIKQQSIELRDKEIEMKNRELVYNVSIIYTKNMIISKIATTLSNGLRNFKQANYELIHEIINELKRNSDEKSWKEFEILFTKVHQSFYDILDEKFPDLTPSERKICAMLKLNMSSKEIAAITMTHPESVDTARSRIRKKLGLEKDENLTEFLNRL